MSTTIDERVVEMRFDNSHFEKNVSTTMSTLEKFKKALNFKTASDSLDGLSKTTKTFHMDGLSNAVQTVSNKFSALEVIGITALANLTNSAVNAGKRIMSSLTVQPITTGFREYELKMSSVQTIMASTGESLATVNKYLNELNEYSDKTIYSFSDMTQSIGKFTNAGVKLEDAVLAMKGISNEAALSGANANEAARAMYNLAQSLSMGYVQYIDWKSIENANMATVQFKTQLAQTAVELGVIKKVGDDTYTTLEGNTYSLQALFKDAMKEEWLTSDVLINTLKDYADETTEIGKKATQAATEVKTFTQMMDTLKESAQSGWAQSWEIVFGDFEEGKNLWTSINNAVGRVIDITNRTRNSILEKAFGKTSGWDKIAEKVENAGIEVEDFKDKLLETAKKHGKVTDEMIDDEKAFSKALENGIFTKEMMIETLESYISGNEGVAKSTEDLTDKLKRFQKIVDEVWNGDFKNGQERVEALTKAGYDYAEIQDLVNKTVDGHKLTLEDLSDVQLESIGYTEDQIAAIKALRDEAAQAGGSFDELLSTMNRPSGRELLIQSFSNIAQELGKFADAAKEAFTNVFGDVDLGENLYNIIEKFHELTSAMEFSEESVANFRSILEGAFSALDISWSLASASFMGGLKILNEILKIFGTDVGGVLAYIADLITKFNNWIEVETIFGSTTKWNDIARILVSVYDGLKQCLDAFINLQVVKDILEDIRQAFVDIFGGNTIDFSIFNIDSICKAIDEMFGKVAEWIKGIDSAENIGRYIIDGIAKGMMAFAGRIVNAVKTVASTIFKTIGKFLNVDEASNWGLYITEGLASGIISGIGNVISAIAELATSLIQSFCSIVGIASPSKVFMAFGEFIIAGLILGLVSKFTNVDEAIKDLATKLTEGGMSLIDSFITGIQNGYAKIKPIVEPIFKKLIDTIMSIDFGSILAIAVGFSMLSFFKTLSTGIDKVGDSLKVLAGPIKGINGVLSAAETGIKNFSTGLTNITKAIETRIKLNAIRDLAVTLLLLVGAIAALVFLVKYDAGSVDKAMQIIIGLAATVAALALVVGKFGPKEAANFTGFGVAMMGVAAAMLGMALAFKIIAGIEYESLQHALLTMGAVVIAIVGIGAIIAAYGKLVKGKATASIKKVGSLMILFAASLLLVAFAMKIAASIPKEDMGKVLTTIFSFAGIIAAMVLLAAIPSKSMRHIGKTMIQIAGAFVIMTYVAKLISGMEWSEMGRAAVGILGLVGIIALLALITTIPGKNKIDSIGDVLSKISIGLLALAVAAKLLASMSWADMGKAAVGLLGLAGIIAILVLITNLIKKDAPKIALTLLAMAVAIGILAAISMMMGLINLGNLAKGVAAVFFLSLAMAAMIAATKTGKDQDIKEARANILALATSIAVMAIAVAALSFIPTENLGRAVSALVGIMLSFAAMTKVATGLNKGVIAPLLIMIAAVGLFAFLLWKLDKLEVKNSLSVAASLSMLLLALSGAMKIISKSTTSNWKDLLVNVAIMSAAIYALGGILYLLKDLPVKSTLANAAALSTLLLALTISMKLLGKGNFAGVDIIPSIAVLTAAVYALGGVLWMIQDLPVETTIPNAVALSILLIAFSGAIAILSAVGPMASMAGPALVALMELVAALTIVLAALGALDQIPGFSKIINDGGKLLCDIGRILGDFVGSVIGGIGEGISGSMPAIAENLSDFMKKLEGFIAGAQSIDDKAMQGVNNLCSMLLKLTGANLLDSILSFGGNSMEDFATQLDIFGKAINDFSKTIKEGDFDASVIEAAANAGLLITELQNSISASGGLAQLFTGDKNLAELGHQLVLFGGAIVGFSKTLSLGGFGEESLASIQAAADAGMLMTKLQSSVEASHGLYQALSGHKNLADLGHQMVLFGSAIVSFSKTVSAEGAISPEAIETAQKAGLLMTELQSSIQPIGGVVSWFSGRTDLSTFGSNLVAYGNAVKNFVTTIGNSGINLESVELAKQAGNIMITLQKSIPENKWFDGKVDLDDFGVKIRRFGEYLASYAHAVADVDSDAINKSVSSATGFVTLARNVVDLDTSGFDNFKIGSIGTALKTYYQNISDIDNGAINKSITAANKLVSLINSMASLDTSGVSSFSSAMSTLGSTNVSGFISTFTASAGQLAAAGGSLVDSVAKGASSKTGALTNVATSAVGSMYKAFVSKSSTFRMAGVTLMNALVSGINSSKSKVANAPISAVSAAVTAIRGYYTNFYNAGYYVVSGFAAGITANTFMAEARARAMAQAAINAAKRELNEHSPSRVFMQIGAYVVEGFAKGIDDNIREASRSASDMANTAVKGVKRAISGIPAYLNGEMDIQPTIRPILDLSDIRSGVGTMNNMLGMQPSVGVMSNLGAISNMMNARSQNGLNSDVVNAIDKLSKRLGNVGNTSYTINGITYDNGSEISEAIGTLVRAAKIERRV